jgi:hypothetical protein
MVTKQQLEGLNVPDTVAIVLGCMTVEELLVCREDETRVGVLSAIVKRETELAELAKDATQGTGAGETMAQDVSKAPDTTSVATDGKKEGDEEGVVLPSHIVLTRPLVFFGEDDKKHSFSAGAHILDPADIAEVVLRGSFEVIE